MTIDTNTKVTNPVINLNLLDKHIDDCTAIINSEIAKGAKADTSLLIRMVTIVTGYLHNNETALNRMQQKIHSAWIDENHPRFVDLKKNTMTQWLNAGGGAVGMAGTLFCTTVLIAAAFAGADPGAIANILKAPQMIFDGVSKGLGMFAAASQAGDTARPMELEYLIQVLQREINQSQSEAQNTLGHETEAMRRLKEILEGIKQKNATFNRALTAQG